ncbi:helicase-related protein [Bacillus infantis]|uniref:RNA helicase n=1 Tax=Bacillus infantis TaxID=324767 RepID=A0A5D4RDG7_9BACI|nr:helicase-related protein [Bacillus infantis]TYS47906.1 RNA helicase [Bacillus infantis]
MEALETLYPLAVEQAKAKILEDIHYYLSTKKSLPEFEAYLQDRKQYYEQIWINVWLNMTNNKVARKLKKDYLQEKGFSTEGIDKKVINSLFRTEVRNYSPWNAEQWLHALYTNDAGKWEQKYRDARESYLLQQQHEENADRIAKAYTALDKSAGKIMRKHTRLFYLRARYEAARQLKNDFSSGTKYGQVDTFALEEKLRPEGHFNPKHYTLAADFFEELTGGIHSTNHWGRQYFEYETYYFKYEKLLMECMKDIVPETVIELMDPAMLEQYRSLHPENDPEAAIHSMTEWPSEELAKEFLEEIENEFLEDLLRLSSFPWEPAVHLEIFRADLEDRERKKAEAKAEEERRKQEEARILDEIFGREYSPSVDRSVKYVLHIGDTNTGKTFHALESMKKADSGIYLAPLRLLALEVYDKLNGENIPCTLKTGEEEKVTPGASHIASTVEMFSEKERFDIIVIDEAQMITDKDRGFSWYKAITKANAGEVHIIGSKSSQSILLQLLDGTDLEIHEYHRDTPLIVEPNEFRLKHSRKGDALICFSRKRVLETASRLQNDGRTVSMIYGSMPPETRKKQVQRFIDGETNMIVSTDAIGMGLNLPIRRVVFLENEKFDGVSRRQLTSQEVKQIAGRAGRKGLYNTGRVAFMENIKEMGSLLEQEDDPVHTFSIAPTSGVFDRFQKYYHDLGTFFELWDKFESPPGTVKASLAEEKELYELVQGTEMEARLSLGDLYGFLHLPFSAREPELVRQWRMSVMASVHNEELPEPSIRKRTLEDLELTYKSVGLHLLFLYRLDQRTEALYWERVRDELGTMVHEKLKTDVQNMTKKCRRCGKKLSWEHPYPICDECHEGGFRTRRKPSYFRR